MGRVTDTRLLAWITGALEPSRAGELEEELLRDPALAARAARLRSKLTPPPPPPADRWRLPPPGYDLGLSGSWAPALVMSEGLRAGDRFTVSLESREPPEQRLVVVLFRSPEGWGVVFPEAPEELLTLADLPRDAGGHLLELMAGPEPGVQRWAVALPRTTTPVDWSLAPAERWRPLRQSMASGQVPVLTLTVPVR
jgi:hypothetical protein